MAPAPSYKRFCCLFCFSSFHIDDSALDNDDYRRNKPSNHKKFSESTAILSGDALQSLAFEILSDEMKNIDTNKQIKLINYLSNKIGPIGMVGGQIIDLSSKKNQLSIDEVNEMHNLKTANLFSFSCQSGAIIGKANKSEIEAFEQYGKNFGITFQIIDDVLDKVGDPENIGKTLGKDETNQNKTYLNFYSIEESLEIAEKYSKKAINSLNMFDQLPEVFINALDFIKSRKF